MEQYISKNDVVAEIERRLEAIANASNENNRELAAIQGAQQYELINLIQFLDTLEVKDVDLEEEIRKWQQKHFEGIGYILDGSGGWIGRTSILNIAKHFFELGMAVSNKAQRGE